MKKLNASAAAVLALAVAVPAFAGGDHCGGYSTTTADAHASCAGKSASAAWAGAWLERSESGKIVVTEVAKNSPAARSGLKAGDIVVAVNGHNLADSEERAMCKTECRVGSAVTYTVQRGRSTKAVKVKLEKMPSNATERFGPRSLFDPMLAAVVVSPVNN